MTDLIRYANARGFAPVAQMQRITIELDKEGRVAWLSMPGAGGSLVVVLPGQGIVIDGLFERVARTEVAPGLAPLGLVPPSER